MPLLDQGRQRSDACQRVADYAETHKPPSGTEPLIGTNTWHVVGYIRKRDTELGKRRTPFHADPHSVRPISSSDKRPGVRHLFHAIQIQTVSWCNRVASSVHPQFPVEKVFMPVEVYIESSSSCKRSTIPDGYSPYLMTNSLLDKRLPRVYCLAARTVLELDSH